MKREWMIAKCVVFGALALVALTTVLMYLWNWLVPTLFSGREINFWQALGLLALSKILFGGKSYWHYKRGDHQHYGHWRAKLSAMSPEEREIFKKRLKEKWGCYNQASDEKQPFANE